MNYNSQFEDLMDSINTTAQGYGFVNGIAWASEAQRAGHLSFPQYKKYENAHKLRVRFSHGNAKDISVSLETYQLVRTWANEISKSSIRRTKKHSNGGGNAPYNGNGTTRNKPKLPLGGFRGKPYIKEFKRKGKDGEEYFFRFSIHREENYLDDGYGGARGFGYFIHIDAAPYLNYALERLHQFHIIKAPYDNHICWDKIIETFEEANAVMFVWVNRYAELIDVLKKDTSISEDQLVAHANKKHVLPSGTFRGRAPKKKPRILKTVYMTQKVYDQIMGVLGKRKPELGGMLGYTLDQDTIDTYVFDSGAKVNSVEYNPNIDYLQTVIEGEWEKKHIFLGGFVHSHPGDFNQLSYADIEYAQRIIEAFELKYIFMPIVTSSYAYKASITGYVVRANGRVDRCNINVVPGKEEKHDVETMEEATSVFECQSDEAIDPDLLKSIEVRFAAMERKRTEGVDSKVTAAEAPRTEETLLSQDNTFARISGIIDVPYMEKCSVIGIGCGGSRSFYESMARMGVGNFYLMDGDILSKSNIASQNGCLSEVGKFKPEIIKQKILDINEAANVNCFNFMLSDEITDEQIEAEIISKIDPSKTVICAFTDSFFAQARISRIALKYRIPFIAGQHHEGGAVSEVVFWYPGVTKYSLREIARTRYEAFENGYVNAVTSVGSPIFNTTRINALCEKIAMGLLLYGQNKTHVYCSFVEAMHERNLILIKQAFLSPEHPLYVLFKNDPGSFFDDVVWLDPTTIEDLENIVLEEGSVGDTREIFLKAQQNS